MKADDAEDDPLLQQISIIKGYIAQAKQAGKMDEVKMLTENLKDLQIVVKKERKREEEKKQEEQRRRENEKRAEEESRAGTAGDESRREDEDYPDMLNPFAEEE